MISSQGRETLPTIETYSQELGPDLKTQKLYNHCATSAIAKSSQAGTSQKQFKSLLVCLLLFFTLKKTLCVRFSFFNRKSHN